MAGLWYVGALIVMLIAWIICLDGKDFFRFFGIGFLLGIIGLIALALVGFPKDRETLIATGLIAGTVQVGLFAILARRYLHLEGWRHVVMVFAYGFGAYVANLVSV